MTVTLVMIACDAGKTIGRALASVKGHVHEIIVVDTGSHDNTKEEARKHGAVVLDFTYETHPQSFLLDVPSSWEKELPGPFTARFWLCDFAAARQYGWDQAAGDYVMWLDTDDTVEGAEKIPAVVADMKALGLDSALLNYDYDHDDAGNVTMRLPRERIVRRGHSHWEQPVHEVLMPAGAAALYQTPNIVHHRGRDKAPVLWHHRNLKILLHWFYSTGATAETADPRMLFYLGLESRTLFPEEAIRHFAAYTLRSGWDEERAMAHFLTGTIHERAGRHHEALTSYSRASVEYPANPDGLFGCARSAFHLERWAKVIEWTDTALAPPKTNARPTMLFEDAHDRRWRPYVYLARALLHLNQIARCIEACETGLKAAPKEIHLTETLREARARQAAPVAGSLGLTLRRTESLEAPPADIPTDVLVLMALQIWKRCETAEKRAAFVGALPVALASDSRVMATRSAQPQAVPQPLRPRPLRIGLLCGGSWELWTPASINEGGIGGSETALVHMAQQLALRGHDVHVFGVAWEGVHGGATYHRGDVEFEGDVLVSSRHAAIADRYKAPVRFVWVHDVHVGDPAIVEADLRKVDGLLALSAWHANQLRGLYPFVPVIQTRNGIDVERFQPAVGADALETTKRRPRIIYASSPDRGLPQLLQVFPQIREITGAELHVYYGFQGLRMVAEAEKNREALARIDALEHTLAATPGVVHHGRVGQQELADAFLSSRLWVYPTWFTETSCITAMEAQAAGCVPVTSRLAALAETVKHGVLIDEPSATAEYNNEFVANVVDLMRGGSETRRVLARRGREHALKNLGWGPVAAQWEQLFLATLAAKNALAPALPQPRLALIYGRFSSGIHGKFDVPALWKTRGLTGSESCCFNLAKAFSEAGCQVDVFCDVAAPYHAVDELAGAHVYPLNAPPDGTYDAYLAWNEPDLLRNVPVDKLRVCVQQLNDFGSYSAPGFDAVVDTYVMPSQILARYLASTEKISAHKISVIPNSINADFFERSYPRGKTIVWCSSPDRGLHVILPIFEQVRKRVKDATLRIFYRYDAWVDDNRKHTGPSADRAREIEAHLARVGRAGENGVIMFDAVSNHRMARELLSSRAFVYTCEPIRFTEGFSVAIMDACAAGCAPIISDADALPEVYGDAAHIIKGRPSEHTAEWVDAICRVLEDDAYATELATRARAFSRKFDRRNIAAQFLDLIEAKRAEKALVVEIANLDFSGVKYKVAHHPAQSYTLFTHEDEDVVRKRWWHIVPGDVVLDIGSAYGSYALTALAQGAHRVVCWSPQGEELLLRKSLEANGWAGRAMVIPRGLWSKPGYLRVYEGTPMSAFTVGPQAGHSFPVDVLDDVVGGIVDPNIRINWIKLDVEGAELEVLRGAEKTIRRHRPNILVENHVFKDAELPAKCAAFLAGLACNYHEVGTVPHHGVSHTLYTAREPG